MLSIGYLESFFYSFWLMISYSHWKWEWENCSYELSIHFGLIISCSHWKWVNKRIVLVNFMLCWKVVGREVYWHWEILRLGNFCWEIFLNCSTTLIQPLPLGVLSIIEIQFSKPKIMGFFRAFLFLFFIQGTFQRRLNTTFLVFDPKKKVELKIWKTSDSLVL